MRRKQVWYRSAAALIIAMIVAIALFQQPGINWLYAADQKENSKTVLGSAAPQPSSGNGTVVASSAPAASVQNPTAAAPPAAPPASQPAATSAPAPQSAGAAKSGLPEEAGFRAIAESSVLKLWVHDATAHFKVENKQTGQVWRSYPNPEQWAKETITGTWRNNLLSPIMLEYIDASNSKSQAKTISWTEDKGVLEGFQTTPNGFKVVFNFTGTQFKIPVEVRLQDDYVDAVIVDPDIKEGKLSLLNLKLYPLLGAEAYNDKQEGYLFVPDGSGALIRFKPNQANDKSFYRANVYGPDSGFFNETTARNPLRIPVFGLKSGAQGLVGVMVSGEEYGKVFASPNGAFGQYNWVTTEWQYRIKFFQNTSKKAQTGFFTYSKDRFTVPERKTRYYFLAPDKSDYVGMAETYRTYLVKDKSLKPVQPKSGEVPVYIDIIGADIKKGLLWDKYLKGTSTAEAIDMIKNLTARGLKNLTVQYAGWQQDGYSSHGGLFPVDSRIGGNEGMQQFIQYAHSQQIPVYLTANYTLNNNGRDRFWPMFDGLRDLAGKVIEFENYANHEMTTLVSPIFTASVAQKDLGSYKALGADGIYFNEGIGQYLNSDYNNSYQASRSEVLKSQQAILKQTKDTLGSVHAENANFYTLNEVNHIHRLADTYSYDIFVDESVPFTQIVLHGLITYTSEWSNLREQYRTDFLRSIELGAYPAYVFTSAPSGTMKGAYSVWYYSMNYRDWEAAAAEEYKRFNEALGDVQDKLIIGHRTLAPNVKETTYEGGKTIIVNYNEQEFTNGSIRVPAQDFIVGKRGAQR
ncbi:DUF5696 domain-containing protein [Paenibacillus sp. WQ 127069]|uniref:DUF5696 domain-containing protein n=1 Tax=Paenibacillus baimaensis TaxID=2982185 RepID=A0ABT2UIA9_9BACL|nr:DUF5696 domain-containing protein [Paenibacillus sp. WQ 127069]MCU6794353.1 DUF5696 domain-containing protein [Paenibacillus sp. WQ 127069]